MFAFQHHALPLYGFSSLQQHGIKHFVSTRHGGVSQGDLGSLNMSFSVGDLPENVRANRAHVAQAMGVDASNLIFGKQTHGNNVALVTGHGKDDLTDADALITNCRGLCIAVTVADCVPILLYDPENEAIAAVHAGWRGTAANIAQKAALKMAEHFGSKPSQMLACIGPSAGPDQYEVGSEVVNVFASSYAQGVVLRRQPNGKAHLNLWEANRQQLAAIGIQQIEMAQICTISQPHEFFSARHFQGKGGRFAAGIVLNP
jgi:hypothetical protein